MSYIIGTDAGPWGQGRWYRSMVEAADDYLRLADCETCPLFNDMIHKIAADRDAQDRITDKEWKRDTFEDMRSVYARKESRVPGTRWFAFVDCATSFLPKWHTKLLLIYYNLLQAGLFNASARLALVQPAAVQVSPEDETDKLGVPLPPGTTKQDTATERDLKRRCANQLQLQAVVLGDGDTYQAIKACVVALSEVRLFHGLQNKHNRSCAAVQGWFAEQAVGGGLQHLLATVAKLSDVAVLEAIGFWTPGQARPCGANAVEGDTHPWTTRENGLAGQLAGLVVRLLGRRFTSMAWFERNLPGKLAGLLVEESRPSVLEWLRLHDSAWRLAETQASTWWKVAHGRSAWRVLVVQKVRYGA